MGGALAHGCGQCVPCRISRRKIWTTRQVLESYCHDENCFVTLTYSETAKRKDGGPCLPEDGRVRPDDLRNWLKRFREKLTSEHPVRFYAVGEYGDRTSRPHYHASLFGVSGRTDILTRSGLVKHWGCSRLVLETWGLGHVYVSEFNRLTAQYVAGHHLKRHSNGSFARMSLRPGIGAVAIPSIVKSLPAGASLSDGRVVRINGGKEYVGPYLSRKLLEARLVSKKEVQDFKDQKAMERSLEMLALHADYKEATFRASFQKSVFQKIQTLEARDKVFHQRNTL